MHKLTFRETLLKTFDEMMSEDPKRFMIGVGLSDESAIFGTLTGLYEKYPDRIFEAPLAENMLTGLVLGAALEGMKPILVHYRADFSLLGMDQLMNHIAKWNAMFGTNEDLPIIIRLIVGGKWGNGGQHSQSLISLYSRVPGIQVVVPGTPSDIPTILKSVKKPTVFIEFKEIYETKEYETQSIVDPDLILYTTGYTYSLAREAIKKFEHRKILIVNVSDPATPQLIPPASTCIFDGIYPDWSNFSSSYAHPFGTAPASHFLENQYWHSVEGIVDIIRELLHE